MEGDGCQEQFYGHFSQNESHRGRYFSYFCLFWLFLSQNDTLSLFIGSRFSRTLIFVKRLLPRPGKVPNLGLGNKIGNWPHNPFFDILAPEPPERGLIRIR